MDRVFDQSGFDKDGYDKDGFDKYGYDRDGYNKKGFDRNLFSRDTNFYYDKDGFDSHGYNRQGYDREGFNEFGIHKDTHTTYNEYGFNKDGYNRYGYDKEGYDRKGFDLEGFDREGYGIDGYNREGYNRRGFNKQGINKETNTKFNSEGHDKTGFTKEQAEERSQRYKKITNYIDELCSKKISIEKYKYISSLSISSLLDVARGSYQLKKYVSPLKKLEEEEKKYLKRFDLDSMLNSVSYIVDGKTISLMDKGDKVKQVEDYLNNNGVYICDYTMRKYVKMYIRNELDLNKTIEENLDISKEQEEKKKIDKEEEIRLRKKMALMEKVRKIKDNNIDKSNKTTKSKRGTV